MTKPVPRSRLNITYRTKIEGTPKNVKLPMRLLVLGDFTGANETRLDERQVQSIMPGMQIKSFMQELNVTAPIDHKDLRESVKGSLTKGRITARFKKQPDAQDTTAELFITGTGVVRGERKKNGLGDFEGPVTLRGEISVPVKQGVLGAPLTSVKLKTTGKVRGDLDNGGLTGSVTGEVTLIVNPAPAPKDPALVLDNNEVSGDVTVDLTIPLFEPGHFKPLNIAASVPKTRRLVILRRILLELRGHISGQPELRDLVKDLVKNRLPDVKELQTYLKARHRQLLIEPEPAPAAGSPPPAPVILSPKIKSVIEALLTASGRNANGWQQQLLVSTSDDATVASPGAVASAAPPVVNLTFLDHDESFPSEDRFVNALAAFLVNVGYQSKPGDKIQKVDNLDDIRDVMMEVNRLSEVLDAKVQEQIHLVLHSKSFQDLEAAWRSLQDICGEVRSNEVIIDFLDIDKKRLGQDLQDHSAYILNSALFRKIYVDEYDRYGGRPFGVMIGLYQFDSTDEDIEWLETMSHIAAAAQCPFIAAVEPRFFKVETWTDLERQDDLETLLSMPQFGRWDAFRGTDHAAYIGLTLPRFMLRAPYDQDSGKSKFLSFEEKIDGPSDYLWGNAAVLLARNMVRSFEESGWCQHIVGPRGGGMIRGLPVHMVMHHGHLELQMPVEIAIPDYRELQFANTGFMSLIHCKGTADSTFFSARSIKKPVEFEEDLATKNADLVCNLAYTLSITRMAHYVKRMVRDYIGSTADAPYIQTMLENWLIGYVTTAVNPDDLTLLYYPFKAMSVAVTPKPGPFGWYNCTVSVLPHIQFQGMDVELRLEAALGGAA